MTPTLLNFLKISNRRPKNHHMTPTKYLAILASFLLAESALAETLYTQDRYNFRTGPIIEYDVQDTFDAGKKVEVIERVGRWIKVKTEEGHVGFIHKRGLDRDNPTTAAVEDCCSNRPKPEEPKTGEAIVAEVQEKYPTKYISPIKDTGQCRTGSRMYACYVHPIKGVPKFHTGIDIRAATGTPIVAPTDGCKVARVRWSNGYGRQIALKCGNYYFEYSHLSKYKSGKKVSNSGLPVGAKIKKGEVIGYVGMSGLCTGPHLHFEVYEGKLERGYRFDPMKLFKSAANVCNSVLKEGKRSKGC